MIDERDEGFAHRIRVRYSDCDMQGVVFNSNYFVYLDDTMDMWLQDRLGTDFHERFDYMVKKAALEWDAPARMRDVVEMRPEVTRWGRSSFDVRVHLAVERAPIGTADFVLISVKPGAHDTPVTVPVPDEVRAALS